MRNSSAAVWMVVAQASSCSGHSATRGGRTLIDCCGRTRAAVNLAGSWRNRSRLALGTGSQPAARLMRGRLGNTPHDERGGADGMP
jgi:hypothetical protein